MSKRATIYNHRFLARIVIEATTPVSIGTGMKNNNTDAPVVRDINGLPFLPASSICGVMRHLYSKLENDKEVKLEDKIFGHQSKNDSEGALLAVTDAKIIGQDGHVIDGIDCPVDPSFLDAYTYLPIREHVKISHKGAACDRGKYDKEVVYKGTRFCFELELCSDNAELSASFDRLLAIFAYEEFRLGGKSGSGYGEMTVKSVHKRALDLSLNSDIKEYVSKTSFLANNNFWTDDMLVGIEESKTMTSTKIYELTLKAKDFILFGAPSGDTDADMVTVKEDVLVWHNGKAQWAKEQVIIPGSSVRGAIAHRTAYHYNKISNIKAEDLDPKSFEEYRKNNEAVKEIFGYAQESREGVESQRGKGKVIFSDLFVSMANEEVKKREKIINHVSIDRFTGGALAGHLFNEKVFYDTDYEYKLKVRLLNSDTIKEEVKEALERSLLDITKGRLALGGGTNRGHGCFSGILK